MYAIQAEGCAPIVRAFDAGEEFATRWDGAVTIATGIRVPKAVGDFLILRAVRDSKGAALAVPEEAIAEAKRAVQLDPLTPTISSHLAWVYFYARQGDDVLRVARQLTDGPARDPYFWSACGYLLKGMNNEAIAALDSAYALTPHPVSQIDLAWTGYIYGLLGAKDMAQAIVDSLIDRSSREHISRNHIAWIYAGFDKPDKMFSYLEGSAFLLLDYGRFRDDPRFIDLARRTGFPLESVIGTYRPLDYGTNH